MSPRRRLAVWAVRGAFVSALGLELLALHFPTPSGVEASARDDVRGAWRFAGRAARTGADHVPGVLSSAIEPLVDDKTIHFLIFLPLGALAAFERRLHAPLTVRLAALLLLGLGVYAGLGEASQVFGGRHPDVGDFVANVLGALVGVLCVALLLRRRASADADVR